MPCRPERRTPRQRPCARWRPLSLRSRRRKLTWSASGSRAPRPSRTLAAAMRTCAKLANAVRTTTATAIATATVVVALAAAAAAAALAPQRARRAPVPRAAHRDARPVAAFTRRTRTQRTNRTPAAPNAHSALRPRMSDRPTWGQTPTLTVRTHAARSPRRSHYAACSSHVSPSTRLAMRIAKAGFATALRHLRLPARAHRRGGHGAGADGGWLPHGATRQPPHEVDALPEHGALPRVGCPALPRACLCLG